MALGPGDRVGRYEIRELLGKGGAGEVYAAFDPLLQRQVALKVMRPDAKDLGDLPASGNTSARVLREARAAARINHPNAAAIYDVGEAAGAPFLAMELIAGRTLRAYVGDASISLEHRVRWLVEVARALGAAHALGVIHRDIKPDNVMVGVDGHAKVVDFGIARRTIPRIGEDGQDSPERWATALATFTAAGIVVGTPLYMAPEQMRGDTLDGRSDEFSWGVLAYELLMGTAPWSGAGVTLVSQILSREIESLPGIPGHVDAVVRRALSKAAKDRFATMEDVAEELEPYAAELSEPMQGGDPVALAPTEQAALVTRGRSPGGDSARDAVVATTTSAPSRSRPRSALLAAGLFVVALASGVVGVRFVASRRAGRGVSSATVASVETESQMSSNAEATAAYRAGMRGLHDAAMGTAWKELNRAIELDPLFAAAHLRRAIVSIVLDVASTDEFFTRHIEQARNSRASLGDHDRILLDAFEPWVEVPPNLDESRRRLEAAERSHPADADFALELGLVLDRTGKPADAAAEFAVAIARDPSLALAWRVIGPERLAMDDAPGAMEAYEQCLKVSPGGTSCLGDLLLLQAGDGKCDELVSTSRRLIALAPESAPAYGALADGLFGNAMPLEAVQGALRQKWEREPPAQRRVAQLEEEASLAIMTGDFAGAESRYVELEQLTASGADEDAHFAFAYARMLVALEGGRRAKAISLAESYLHRRAAWAPGRFDRSIIVRGVELLAGGITRAEYDELHKHWLERDPGGDAGFRWIEALALVVKSPADARAALKAKPEVRPLVSALQMTPSMMESLGRTYLLAEHLEEAIRYLTRASASCVSLAEIDEALPATRAALELGSALEQRGDVTGACAAFNRVLERWGPAGTASRTALEARSRKQKLGCAP